MEHIQKKEGKNLPDVVLWPHPENVIIKFCRLASDKICSLIVILRAVQS